MTSPLIDAGAAPAGPALYDLTPRQRLEQVMSRLPPATSVLSEDSAAAPSRGELIEPLKRINEVMRGYGLEFSLDEDSGRWITRVIDRESGELLRQIPAEEVLAIARRLDQGQGLILRSSA